MDTTKIKDNDWDLSVNKYREEEEAIVNHRESKVIIAEAKKEVKELMEGFDKLGQLTK